MRIWIDGRNRERLCCGCGEFRASHTISKTRLTAACILDPQVRLWSVETGQPLFRLDGHSSLVGLLGLSYHYLVSAGADSNLKIWNPANGECIDTLVANGGAITCFMHDEFRIVSGAEGQLRIWDIRKGTVVRDVLENMNGVWQVGFNDRFCVAAVQRGAHTEFESRSDVRPPIK